MTPNPDTYAARTDNGTFTFIMPPPVVGYWIFPGSIPACATRFAMVSRPSWFHRWTMRILLGFKWEDV